MKKLIFVLEICLFCSIQILNADCNDAKNIGEGLTYMYNPPRVDKADLDIYLFALSNEVYYVVSNDYNDEVLTYKISAPTSIHLVSPDKYTNITYEVKTFYTNENCGIDPIKTYSIQTGIYNRYTESSACTNASTYIERCKEYYSPDEIKKFNADKELTQEDYDNLVKEDIKNGNTSIKEDKRTLKEKINDYIKEYYLYVLIPFITVTIVFIIRMIVIKRRKKIKDEY